VKSIATNRRVRDDGKVSKAGARSVAGVRKLQGIRNDMQHWPLHGVVSERAKGAVEGAVGFSRTGAVVAASRWAPYLGVRHGGGGEAQTRARVLVPVTCRRTADVRVGG